MADLQSRVKEYGDDVTLFAGQLGLSLTESGEVADWANNLVQTVRDGGTEIKDIFPLADQKFNSESMFRYAMFVLGALFGRCMVG